MRRYVTIGGIVVTMLLAGSVTALAQAPVPDPTCAPASPNPGGVNPGGPVSPEPEPGGTVPAPIPVPPREVPAAPVPHTECL